MSIQPFSKSYWNKLRKILIVGSSISIQRNGYLPRMLELINKKTFKTHRSLNASLGGTPTIASLAYVANNLFFDTDEFRPDVAIIEKAPNERIFSKPPTSKQVEEKYHEIILNTTKLAILFLQQGCMPVLICSYFKEDDIYSCDVSSEKSFITKAYQEVASRVGIPLINFGSFLAEKISEEGSDLNDIMLLDDCHLTDAGADLMASYVANSLLSLDLNHYYLNIVKCGKENTNGATTIKFPEIIRPELHHSFSSAIVSTSYHQLDYSKSLSVRLSSEKPLSLIGIFVVSDQASPWLRILIYDNRGKQPSGESTVCLFDRMSFFPRINYIDTTSCVICGQKIELSVSPLAVQVELAIDSFWSSKTFDPNERWAQEKYLKPLMDRKDGRIQVSSKIIGFVFQDLGPEIGCDDNHHLVSEYPHLSNKADIPTFSTSPFQEDRSNIHRQDAIAMKGAALESILASKKSHADNMTRTYSKTFFDPTDPDTKRHYIMLEEGKKLINHINPSSLLTIGDNLGRDAGFFKSAIPSTFCIASDLDSNHLKKAVDEGWFDVAYDVDVENIPFSDSSIDIVVAKETFHHWPRPILGVYEMLRVAKKCILLIEPNDFIRGDASRPFIEASAYTDAYEKVGNYKYQVSIREILKVCWSLYLPGCATIGFNDPWKKPFCFDTWLLEKNRLDQLGVEGARQFNLFAIAIFKDDKDLESILPAGRIKIYKRPLNPFKDQMT